MPLRAAIVVPYRGGEPLREARWMRVREHLDTHLPRWPIITADDERWARFNRAASRNLGVQIAEAAGYSTVITCDADTLLDPAGVEWAVAVADSVDRMVIPFRWYVSLDFEGTEDAMREPWAARDGWTSWGQLDWSVGGSMVMPTHLWWELGGMDDRFTGWGGEDMAFLIAHRALLGADAIRPVGNNWRCFHLAHETSHDPDSPEHRQYVEHYRRWERAGDRGAAAVRALLSERDGVQA
jgi:hypothetical protein